jgi:cytochrome P450
MSQWLMHHNEKYFPDPFKFDPLRWVPEAQNSRPRFSYFPFGGGARQCIGESFAWMEGILLLASIGQNWQLRLLPGIEVKPNPLITLRPKYPLKMILKHR